MELVAKVLLANWADLPPVHVGSGIDGPLDYFRPKI
jgi:hypothetical protein